MIKISQKGSEFNVKDYPSIEIKSRENISAKGRRSKGSIGPRTKRRLVPMMGHKTWEMSAEPVPSFPLKVALLVLFPAPLVCHKELFQDPFYFNSLLYADDLNCFPQFRPQSIMFSCR